jgi:methylmalonyl-CoA epimerase
MIKKIDHIGIVVKSTEELVEVLSRLFGFRVTESLSFPEQGFKSTLISQEEVTIELIEPVGPTGIIQRFMEKRGPGLHHISLQVDNLEQEIKALKAKGVQLLGEEPRQVSESSKIIFAHPSSVGGILVELAYREQPDSNKQDSKNAGGKKI